MRQLKSEKILTEIARATEELLQWARDNPDCTLRELEERVQQWKTRIGRQLLEEALAIQGEGKWPEGTCSCGGQWVFEGYRDLKG